MFRKKQDTAHIHRAVGFPWVEGISRLNMRSIGMFISAHRDGCDECTHKHARNALQYPDEIAAFLGSAYAWALRQTKASPDDLINSSDDEEGEPLFRDAAAGLLRLGVAGQVAEMLMRARDAPGGVRVELLNDAGMAYSLERTALWTSEPEETPPPWTESIGPALEFLAAQAHENAGVAEPAPEEAPVPEESPQPEENPEPAAPASGSGPALVIGDRVARQFVSAGDPVPRWRRIGRWCLSRLEQWADHRGFPAPPGCGPGEGPVPDVEDVPVGLVHVADHDRSAGAVLQQPQGRPSGAVPGADEPSPSAHPAGAGFRPGSRGPGAGKPLVPPDGGNSRPESEPERRPEPMPASGEPQNGADADPEAERWHPVGLDTARELLADPERAHAHTQKQRLRALLYEHAGHTAPVRTAWRELYDADPPSALYRYRTAWHREITVALLTHTGSPDRVREILRAEGVQMRPEVAQVLARGVPSRA